jgi:hypothetical protein
MHIKAGTSKVRDLAKCMKSSQAIENKLREVPIKIYENFQDQVL